MSQCPPARYSTAEDIERPEWAKIAHKLKITLDGLPAYRVLAYDVEAGTLTRLVVDRKGRALLDPRKPHQFLTQTVHGKVEVEWKEGDA